MGIRLIILLGLLVGVLYCIHILVKDYQALTAPKLLRLLFKRDVIAFNTKHSVRWRKILRYDPLQCARYLYCDLGVRPPDNELRRGFINMLYLEPSEDDKEALEEFKLAYYYGQLYHEQPELCAKKYSTCPFGVPLLYDIVRYLVKEGQ